MLLIPGRPIESQNDIDAYTVHHRIERDGARTVVLTGVLPTDPGVFHWAVIQRHVAGWTCLATGTHPGRITDTAETVAALIGQHHGDGLDRIPAEHYRVSRPGGEVIHQRRAAVEPLAYCGTTNTGAPYEHISRPGRYEQHCTGCTEAYQAEHYGRMPVQA